MPRNLWIISKPAWCAGFPVDGRRSKCFITRCSRRRPAEIWSGADVRPRGPVVDWARILAGCLLKPLSAIGNRQIAWEELQTGGVPNGLVRSPDTPGEARMYQRLCARCAKRRMNTSGLAPGIRDSSNLMASGCAT